jgi:hypothetical protein
MPHGPHQPSDRGRSPLTGARPAQETQSTAHPFRAPTPTSDSRFRRSSISPNALGFLEQKRRKSTRTQRVARTNARPPAHGYKCRSTPPLLTSSLPRAVSDYRYTPPPNDDCSITLRSWVSRSTCRVRLPSIEQGWWRPLFSIFQIGFLCRCPVYADDELPFEEAFYLIVQMVSNN